MLRSRSISGITLALAIGLAIPLAAPPVAEIDADTGLNGQRVMWVFLRDKPAAGRSGEGESIDAPLDPAYLERIHRRGIALREHSRWLNAVSVEATDGQTRWLRAQPFVKEVKPVARLARPRAGLTEPGRAGSPKQYAGERQDDYGPSFQQLSSIGVTVLHGRGYRGLGVRIGLLDSGFNFREHPAFADLRVVATRDFVNDDDIVWDETAQSQTGDETISDQNGHGTRVLSLLAAQAPGFMIGAAPEADYILAKVEDIGEELPVEEDRWIAGVEWAVGQGARVINSSLGYTTWDDGSGYTYPDLDGRTAAASIVAGMAVEQGTVIVSAAGNEGNTPWRYINVPADAEEVITVGSVGVFSLELDPSSSRGPTPDGRIKPDVVAPGAGVVVATADGSYARPSGTSLATPLVAGTCALLLQIHPEWDPGEVAAALRLTARDLGEAGADTAYGWGLVDAVAASGLEVDVPTVSAGRAPFPNPLMLSSAGGTVCFPLELSRRDEVAVHIYELSGNKVAELSRQMEAGAFTDLEAGCECESECARALLRWPVPGRLNSGLYIYRVQAETFSHTGKLALIRTGE